MNERIIARIAELYYVHNISQYEIAKKFNFSKSKVCRIIKDAKKKKIINFSIKNFDLRIIDLEKSLENKFGIKEAIIYVNSENEEYNEDLVLKEIGFIGARFIERILKDNLNIALSWGKTLYNVFENIKSDKNYKVKIFATLGGVTTDDIKTHNNNLVNILFGKIGGKTYPIYMPLVLGSNKMKKILSKEHSIKEVLGDFSEVDYYFAGIGVVSDKSNMYNPEGEFNKDLIKKLNEKKICGEIGLNFYDIDGNFISSGLEERTIALSVSEIKKFKNNVIVAFGKDKIIPLKGILRAGIVNILITDSFTAKHLLYDNNYS